MSSKKLSKIGKYLGVGERIRKIRGHLSQTAFGNFLGVTAAAISRWESGRIPAEEHRKKITDFGKVTDEWLLYGEDQYAAQLKEHAPEIYDTRPAVLKVDNLVRSILLARKFQKSQRHKLSESGEAQLISYIYEYIETEYADPGEVVIRRLADLIQRQKQED